MQDIDTLERDLSDQIANAGTEAALEDIRIASLGKKGSISLAMRELGKMTPDERKEQGPLLNGLKSRVTDLIADRKQALELIALEARLATERVDITLPTREEPQGTLHPNSQVMDEVIAIMADMGFSVKEGPEVEDDFHNFTALNIPESHPARQMHDTFYMASGDDIVLRTHTSPVQIRTMQDEKPPIRIIVPGRTYRCDSDQTHTPMFHQIEGLVIEPGIHMGHLKYVLEEFCQTFFEVDNVELRFRPSHFPFTEPSMEVDVRCDRSGGEMKIGQGDDWLEILGCGMVHPNVLRNVGYDPDEVQGFAYGMGLDRLAMLKYGIADLRAVFECDLRWLRHYGFSVLDMPSLAGGLSR